jgi:hypothetical protein
VVIANTIEPRKAGKKPRISKPGIGVNSLANQRVNALTTSVNNPKVNKVMGNVNKLKIGRMIAFTRPMTAAATKAAIKLLIINPGTILEVIDNAKAEPIQVNRKCFIILAE